jgi:hypothetical protein
VTLFDFLSLKNDVNVPSKCDKQNFLKLFFVGILKSEAWIRGCDPDPDLHQCHGSATLSGTEDKTMVHAAPTAGTTVPGTGTICTPDDVSTVYD